MRELLRIKEIRGAQVGVAHFHVSIDTAHIQRKVDFCVFKVVQIRSGPSLKIIKGTSDRRNDQVFDFKLNFRMRGVYDPFCNCHRCFI
ncbi:hypothetical protein D3C87_1941820 [compost metagenome]